MQHASMSRTPSPKHHSIIDVVQRLRDRLGEDTFAIADHWEADQCAIGIASSREPGRLAYICTFGKPSGCYDLSLELPPLDPAAYPYTPAGNAIDIDFDTLATSIARHFGGSRRDPAC
jgi:hypothetical protein